MIELERPLSRHTPSVVAVRVNGETVVVKISNIMTLKGDIGHVIV